MSVLPSLRSPVLSFARPKSRILTRPSARQEEVLGLQVPVHDPLLVRRGEALGDLHRVVDRLAHRQRPAEETRPQRLALEQLRHDVRRAVCRSDVVDRRDVGMVEAPAARASCSKRFNRSGSCEKDAGRTLIATSRPSRGSFARYTSPIPPAPDRREDLVGTEPVRARVERRLHALDPSIQVRENAVEAVDVSVTAASRNDVQGVDARCVGRHQGSPELFASSRDVEPKDLRRQLHSAVDVQKTAIEAHLVHAVFRIDTGHHGRLPSGERIEVGLPIGPAGRRPTCRPGSRACGRYPSGVTA